MSKTLQGLSGPLAAPHSQPWRRLAALALRCTSHAMVRLSRRLHGRPGPARPAHAPELEFYAEAGAPEGALYLDGEYVGHVPGVSRL